MAKRGLRNGDIIQNVLYAGLDKSRRKFLSAQVTHTVIPSDKFKNREHSHKNHAHGRGLPDGNGRALRPWS